MASRAKTLSFIFLVLIALVAAGIYYLASNLNQIVAGVIESQGSAVTGTDVRVEGVDIRLTEAAASISGLSIGNPEGFAGEAMELGAFSIRLNASSLTEDTIVVERILIDGARVNVIQQGPRNNLQEILANLEQPQSGDAAAVEEEGGKRLIIDSFTFQGATASLTAPGLEEKREVTIPDVNVRNIGRSANGATAAQVAKQVLRPVVEAAIASSAGQAVKARAEEELNKAMGGFLEKIGGKAEKEK